MGLSKLQETVKAREARHAAVHGVAKSQTSLGDQTTKPSLALSFLLSPTLTSIHDHWKNYSLDSTNLC